MNVFKLNQDWTYNCSLLQLKHHRTMIRPIHFIPMIRSLKPILKLTIRHKVIKSPPHVLLTHTWAITPPSVMITTFFKLAKSIDVMSKARIGLPGIGLLNQATRITLYQSVTSEPPVPTAASFI